MASDSRQRLLVIGAGGFFGGYVARAAAREFDVVRGCRQGGDVAIDVTAPEIVAAAFARARPDVVALLAALSDIDRCERDPELAEAVNVRGVENVAEQCRRHRARLVFTSSGAVFDGARHGYTEVDPVNPISVYGRTKARAEALLAGLLPDSAIVRPALILGLAPPPEGNSLVNRVAANLRAHRPVFAPEDEYRNPIDAADLAETVVALAARADARGLFHVGSSDSLSRYELTRRLAERMGFSSDLVRLQREPVPGRAPRGRDHFLIPGRVAAFRRTGVPSSDDVIERALRATT